MVHKPIFNIFSRDFLHSPGNFMCLNANLTIRTHILSLGALFLDLLRGRFFGEKNRTKNAAVSTIFEIRHRDMAHLKALLILVKKGKIISFDTTNGFPTKWTSKK